MFAVEQMTLNECDQDKVIQFPLAISKNKVTYKQVEPHRADVIPDMETIESIKAYLLSKTGRHGYRNYMIFLTGLECGRRCGDILKLRVCDVWDGDQVFDEVWHVEEKTSRKENSKSENIAEVVVKKRIMNFVLSDKFRQELKAYIIQRHLGMNDYLFASQKPDENGDLRLGTRSYYAILRKVNGDLELKFHFSTHSMRKTYARYRYEEMKRNRDKYDIEPLSMIQWMLGHKSPEVTLRYLDITNEEQKKLVNNVTFC